MPACSRPSLPASYPVRKCSLSGGFRSGSRGDNGRAAAETFAAENQGGTHGLDDLDSSRRCRRRNDLGRERQLVRLQRAHGRVILLVVGIIGAVLSLASGRAGEASAAAATLSRRGGTPDRRSLGERRVERFDDAQLIRELGDLEHAPDDVVRRADDAQLDPLAASARRQRTRAFSPDQSRKLTSERSTTTRRHDSAASSTASLTRGEVAMSTSPTTSTIRMSAAREELSSKAGVVTWEGEGVAAKAPSPTLARRKEGAQRAAVRGAGLGPRGFRRPGARAVRVPSASESISTLSIMLRMSTIPRPRSSLGCGSCQRPRSATSTRSRSVVEGSSRGATMPPGSA